MDKRKKLNRFLSPAKRQIKQSVSNIGGDVDVSERSKREKVKGLSFIGKSNLSKENSEIGGGSEDDELPLSTGGGKRFKVHSKPLNECNAIDHAAVPRKLRSATIKRSRESLSPPLPGAQKLHHTSNETQRPQINGAKKSKQKMKQGGSANKSCVQAESIPITKDEEEVAETLYALARMVPDDNPLKSPVDQKNSEAKSTHLQDMESPVLASEAPKEASTRSYKPSISDVATNLLSTDEGSVSDAVQVKCLTESTFQDRHIIFGKHKFDLSLSSISPPDLNISLLAKSEHTDDKPLSLAAELGVSTEQCHGTRSTQATQHGPSFCEQKPELWPVAVIGTKLEEQFINKNKDSEASLACIEGTPALSVGVGTNSGLGLSMVGSHGGDLHWSSSSKVPAWLDSATSSTKPNSIGKDVSKEKVNPVAVDRKQSLKKCATHVYISRLLLENQASEKKPRWAVPIDQIKPGGAKLGANWLVSVGDRNGLNGVISVGSSNASESGKNMSEVRSGIVKVKQSCDFLSLSTYGGGSNDINQGGNKLDSSAQFHVPYLHPILQNRQIMPFPVHGRPSSTLSDQLTVAAAQQLQSTQHMRSPFYGQQQLIHADPAKQQLTQQQQLHQMWTAHQTPGRNSTFHLPKWLNGKHDSPLIPSGGQPLLPTSHPQDVLTAKFSPSLQQQQLFFASPSSSSSSSSSSSRGKTRHHHHHIPGGYDGGGGGFHSESLTVHLT